MPKFLALLDDPDFGEPCVFSCNAQPTQRKAGGAVDDPDYLCEAVGAAFAARYDVPTASSDDGAQKGGKKGRRKNDDSDSDDAGEQYGGKKEKGGAGKQSAFLKLSDHIKGVNLYDLIGISEGASQDEIRKAYRALALTAHPDKQKAGATEEEIKEVQERFVQIQEAYEILSEPAKRQQYDSSLDFDESLPKFKPDGDENFYEVFSECFKRNARFSVKRPVPEIGGPDSKPEEWKRFYNFWYEFQSWRDPVVMAQAAGEDICDLNDSECRDERRWMVRENARIAKNYKREETERISRLVTLAEKFDPRIQAEKDAKKAAKQADAAKKAEIANKAKRAKEEEEKRKKEEEDKLQAAQEAKRKQEKAAREAEKNKIKACRQRLRSFHPKVKSFVLMDQLNEVCLRFGEEELKTLGDEVESALKKKGPKGVERAAKAMHDAIETIGLKPVTTVEDDDAESTSSGPSSNTPEDPAVVKQREIEQARLAKIQEKEEKERAAEKAKKDAEKAEQQKVRNEQKRKEQAALEVAKRQQEKKELEKNKKAEERKKKQEQDDKAAKEQQKEEARQRAAEQAAADRQRSLAMKMEQEMERIVQTFTSDRLDRLTLLDAATDESLLGVLTQAAQEDAALQGALAILKLESAAAEEVLNRGMGLFFKLGPIWCLGLLLDPEIKLPNAVRNRAKKARQRLQNLVQGFLDKLSVPASADQAAASEWQRDVANGSVEVPVFNLEMKEDEEAAAKAAQEAVKAEKAAEEPASKAKKKKGGKGKEGGDDLDSLLAAIEDPNVSPKKMKGKKK